MNKGFFEINDKSKTQSFKVAFAPLGDDVIQVDVDGSGLLYYSGKLDEDLLLEIHTNINIRLTNLCDKLNLDSSLIGYHFDLLPTKKFNNFKNSFYYQCKLVIIFQKPLVNLSGFDIPEIVEMITSNTLGEIFMTND